MTKDIAVSREGHVATIEIRRPPLNFFDLTLIRDIADALDAIDADPQIRAVMLCAEGKAFCAGADFSSPASATPADTELLDTTGHLYLEAVRIFRCKKPIVAAVQGAAIGGGLGLAMAADFRVASPEARFAANFTRLGFHPGFGLTVTLPEIVGKNNAELMFYTSRRVGGEEACRMGLANILTNQETLRQTAHSLAAEIAECSPLGLLSTRATMRAGLAERVHAATLHELAEQERLRQTADFAEGVRSTAERRPGNFIGR